MKTIAWSKIFTQLIATSGVMLLTMQTGMIDGWSSPNLARLTKGNSTITLTKSEVSWLASCLKLGRFVSIVLVPIFMELAGSKKAILYSFIPVGVSWMMTMTAKTAMFLYIARFLSGITYGLTYGYYSIYLGEIAVPELRGTLITAAAIGWPIASLGATLGETYLSQIVSNTIYLMMCLLGIFLFLWLPDSPYQLIKDDEPVKARESLQWFRCNGNTATEMEEIIEYVQATGRVTFSEKMKQLKLPPNRRAVILVAMLFVYAQFSGLFNILYYMEIILTNSEFHLVEPSQMVVYTNVILLVSNIATVNLTDKMGRQILLLVSSTLMTIALFTLAVHFYLLNNVKVNPVSIQGLPAASIIILHVAFSTGFSPVMCALLGEMFPASIKSTAATIITCASAVSGFISTKGYQPLIDAIGEAYVYCVYAVIMATSIPVVMVLLPETKGKSLQEIQNLLNQK